jgi:hypothetical protein
LKEIRVSGLGGLLPNPGNIFLQAGNSGIKDYIKISLNRKKLLAGLFTDVLSEFTF